LLLFQLNIEIILVISIFGKKKNWISAKFLLFKGYPRDLRKHTTYIDEYKGEIIQTKPEAEMDEILDANPTEKAVNISKTCVIGANAPTTCNAAYANDTKKRSGFLYNAALISLAPTKTAAITQKTNCSK
jgi:hypothetical protein